jgi:hypothetical protein
VKFEFEINSNSNSSLNLKPKLFEVLLLTWAETHLYLKPAAQLTQRASRYRCPPNQPFCFPSLHSLTCGTHPSATTSLLPSYLLLFSPRTATAPHRAASTHTRDGTGRPPGGTHGEPGCARARASGSPQGERLLCPFPATPKEMALATAAPPRRGIHRASQPGRAALHALASLLTAPTTRGGQAPPTSRVALGFCPFPVRRRKERRGEKSGGARVGRRRRG